MAEFAPTRAAQCLQNVVATFTAREQELGRLDAAAGDGDHGTTMVRGLRAAATAVEGSPADLGARLVCAGEAFADAAGGASGALFGALITTMGRKLTVAGGTPSPADVSAALDAGVAVVAKLGKAAQGDKTLLDALAPFAGAFAAAVAAGGSVAGAWHAAVPAAEAGARATAEMVARRGRAARLGERSRGSVDPGAQSVVYLVTAIDAALQEVPDRD
jgi:dihydroxyacetone kinase